jgi:hypothetical protein
MISFETYQRIRVELRQMIADWMSRAPWIHGVGFGLKQVAGRDLNQDALVFLVDVKMAERQLAADSIIPQWVSFGRGELVFPTDVRPAYPGWFLSAPSCTNMRPAHGGDCIAPLGSPMVGTLGATLLRKADGWPFILSASHTMSGVGGTAPTKIISHPIGSSSEIADLSGSTIWSTSAPMEGDAALAKVTSAKEPNGKYAAEPGVNNIPGVSGMAAPVSGDAIRFSGMHGLKQGTIYLTFATVTLSPFKFENTFLLIPPNADSLAEIGDSGAVAVNASNQIVGIVFGANGYLTFCTDLTAVADTLSLSDYNF